ncbi:MAG: LysR family transcriptional regulator [Negativicutes bacterium]
MDIRQLQYFLTIAEEGQITGAAKKLHIAQPALSQQLRLLEEELSTQLVERGSRKIRLTEAGCLLRDRASQVLNLLGAATQEIQELTHGQKGTVSIGVVPSSGAKLLPDRVRIFHEKYPEINFQIFDGETFQLLDMLKFGIIDFAIVRASFSLQPYRSIGLSSEPMMAVMQKDYSCGKHPKLIHMIELAEIALIIHRGSVARIVEYCRQSGFEPRIVCKGNDVRSVLALANAGVGVAVVPQSSTTFAPMDNLVCKEIADQALNLSRVIVWPKDRNLSAAAKNFLESFID